MTAQPHSARRRADLAHLGDKAAVAACALVLATGCATHAASPVTDANGDTLSPVADFNLFKQALPTKKDFPQDWQVQEQDDRPVASPGLSDTGTVIHEVVPNRCQQFTSGFISSPGSSIPGNFVASTLAMIPNSKGEIDQSSVVVYATKDAGDWEAPALIQDSVRDCAKVTGKMDMQGHTMDISFVSGPIDTAVIHGEAAGRTTTITASEARILMAVVHARTKGFLISASSMVVSGSEDDQKTLLVRLVGQTVDKLNAL